MATFSGYAGSSTDERCFLSSSGGPFTDPIWIGGPFGETSKAYVRIPNVTIPQGSTVSSAVLSIKPQTPMTPTATIVTINGHDVDSSTSPANVSALNSAAKTSAINWTLPSVSSARFNSADFASVLQTILARAGWASGNAAGFFIEWSSGGSYIPCLTYGYGTTECFRLDVTYSAGGSGPGNLVRNGSLSVFNALGGRL